MKTKKILFIFLVSIILVSKMVFAQKGSSLQNHITTIWRKEVINKANNPPPTALPPTAPPPIDFDSRFNILKMHHPFNYPILHQDYLDRKFHGNILPFGKENKKKSMIPTNTSRFYYNESWEDLLFNYLEASEFKQSCELLLELEYDVIIRSGPDYNYDIIENLKKDKFIRITSDELRKGLHNWKNYKKEILNPDLIQQQEVDVWERLEKSSRYKLWLELIEPKGWINIIDFLTDNITDDIIVKSNYQERIDDKNGANLLYAFNNFNIINNSNHNQEDNENNSEVITLKRKTYVRSGPSHKSKVNRILLKGEKILIDKNKLTRAFESLKIQNKKDERWLELVKPKGWIYLKDFMSDYNTDSSRRRINIF